MNSKEIREKFENLYFNQDECRPRYNNEVGYISDDVFETTDVLDLDKNLNSYCAGYRSREPEIQALNEKIDRLNAELAQIQDAYIARDCEAKSYLDNEF